MSARLLSAWNRFWFSPSLEYQYGILRILLLGHLFRMELRGADWWRTTAANTPLELFEPCFAARWLSPSAELVAARAGEIQLLATIMALSAALGIFARFSLAGYAYLFIVKQAFLNSFGAFHHHTPLVAVALVVLVFAPGASDVSIDAGVRARWRKPVSPGARTDRPFWGGPHPVWPARLILCFMALLYFSAGFSKLHHGGLRWLDGQTLAFNLSEKRQGFFVSGPETRDADRWRDGFGLESFVYDARENTELAHRLSRSRAFTRIGAWFTVLFELGFPLILVSRRLCVAWMLALALFSFWTGATMGINFLVMFWPLCFLAVDWRWIMGRFGVPAPSRPG